MRTANQILILTVITTVFFVPALAMDATSLPEDLNRPLIAQPFPQLAGIKILYLQIEMPESEAKMHSTVWQEMKRNAERKLGQAGIIPVLRAYNGYQIMFPFLKVNTDILTLKDSRQSVFHIRTSLARAVHLNPALSWSIQADVWQADEVMQAAPTENMPAEVTKATLAQIDEFIADYRTANPPGDKSADANDIATVLPVVPVEKTTPVVKPVTAKYKLVASKNSKVFHKSDCIWANRIKPANLVTFSTRDQAIQAGKRPCKQCKP